MVGNVDTTKINVRWEFGFQVKKAREVTSMLVLMTMFRFVTYLQTCCI